MLPNVCEVSFAIMLLLAVSAGCFYNEKPRLVLCQASCDLAACGGSGKRRCWGTAPDPSQGADRPLHPPLHLRNGVAGA